MGSNPPGDEAERGTGSLSDGRIWIAPDALWYRLQVEDVTVDEGDLVRRVRRLEFQTLDGLVVGTTAVPGFFRLGLASAAEIETTWRKVVGPLDPSED